MDSWDDRSWLLDDALIEADMMSELQSTSFWEGYREDWTPVEERPLMEDEFDWAA